jgi:hypothetical protein
MKTSQISLNALKAANTCACTEASRYYICGVLLTVAARHSLYVATDGHTMFVHREDLKADADPNTLLGSWIVPSDAIAKIKSGKGRFAELPMDLKQDAEGRLVFERSGDVLAVTKPIDGTFPQWQRVIPPAIEKGAKVERVHFNPLLLAQIAKAAAFLQITPNSCMVHTRASNEPCGVTFGGGNPQTFAVIMPVRCDYLGQWEGLPAWAGGQAPKAETQQAAE